MTTETPPVRVVVADDHPMFRFGLVAALAGAEEVEVVGEAAARRRSAGTFRSTRPGRAPW